VVDWRSEIKAIVWECGSSLRRLRDQPPEGRARRAGQILTGGLARCVRTLRTRRDVIVVSRAKSGRTWLRYMLDHLGLHLEYTHSEPAEIPDMLANRRLVFLHRDPRDVLVSKWFARRKRTGDFSGSLGDLARDPAGGLEAIIRFNLEWREIAGRGGLVLSYEGLRQDTEAELRRVADFVSPDPVPDSRIRAAVEAGRFSNMQAAERSGLGADLYGWALRPGDPGDAGSYKVREGKAGGWGGHFSEADAAYAEVLLRRYDYFARMGEGARIGSTISRSSDEEMT
jgi:hypothetical protein